MKSTFSWLDTSDQDRQRALDAIDLFSLRDTRDELGLGSIRDAWADRLLPGTSTIQTRARYFLFIPWIYQDLQRKGVQPDEIASKARKAELRLIDAILERDKDAVPIGAFAGLELKRLPSSIYWNGLAVLRIRLFEGSLDAFHRSFGRWERKEEIEQGQFLNHGAWNPHLPPAPADFPAQLSLRLEAVEAEFLQKQIQLHATGSLFAFLVSQTGFTGGAAYPWQHAALPDMPYTLRGWIGHAERFAVTMHGAALLYNLMLAEQAQSISLNIGTNQGGLVAYYREQMQSWARDVESLGPQLDSWNRAEFWALTRDINARIPPPSESFANQWIDFVLHASAPSKLIDSAEARALVEEREGRLKRHRSRLRHREQLERWSGRAGANRIDYRWGIAQRLVADIQEGLGHK